MSTTYRGARAETHKGPALQGLRVCVAWSSSWCAGAGLLPSWCGGLGATAACGTAVLVVTLTHPAHAQETVGADVWLGSSLFTIEDQENLVAYANLNDAEKDAAGELMRAGMVQARTLSLEFMRGWERAWQEEDDEDWDERRKRWAKRYDDHLARVVSIEKQVMQDLQALLSEEQRTRGWSHFERSRRRLLLRGDDSEMGTNVDVVAMLRAIRPTREELAGVAPFLESYETTLDQLITERRPLQRFFGNSPRRWYADDSDQITEADSARYNDVSKRIRQLHVRAARQIEEALTDARRADFQRQRLRIEMSYDWTPMLRWNRVRQILRIRSLSAEQKAQVRQLALDADAALMRRMVAQKRKLDEAVLVDKKIQEQSDEEQKQYSKERRKAQDELLTNVLALLTPQQKLAYESGLENEQDVMAAFERRRYGKSQWEVDSDLFPALEDGEDDVEAADAGDGGWP